MVAAANCNSRQCRLSSLVLLALPITVIAQAPIIQPGAPGQPSRTLDAETAGLIAGATYSAADVQFMQDMIPHHHQALEMAELVADRTNNSDLDDVAGRIDASQQDEIEFMQQWLRDRDQLVPDPEDHDAMMTGHQMAGMATPEQMEALRAARGTEFDRLFLELMITHHLGAVSMVEELHATGGTAFDPVLFEFTNDISNGQTAEVERMSALMIGLSRDPRVGLEAGFDDAEIAISNLRLVGSLPKPPGFFDPDNPAGLPPERPPRNRGGRGGGGADDQDDDEAAETTNAQASADAEDEDAAETVADTDSDDAEDEDEEADEAGPARRRPPFNRSPLLSFSNTDMAFFDDVLVTGSYHGFNIYRLHDGGLPALLSSVVCPGGQGDVSVVEHLLIMSVEQTRGRVDCGLDGVAEDVSPERFRGIRIFDISDLTLPVQVGAVQTCRGSHTHSVVSGPGADGKIIVYNSGTSRVREEEELAGCIGAIPGDERTALFRIDVIEIPVADPASARIVASPAVFADPESGILAGLWRGGDHGDDTQSTSTTDQCHDITVFPAKRLAAGACSGNGILFDISDPFNPQRLDAVVDAGFAYWHSATFNNDGTKVIFTDEWGGGGRPRCRTFDPLTWGADAIYDIVDGKLEPRGYFKMPAPQAEEENCVAHNGAIVPVPGRDIFVQAWYQGGITLIDFTDSANPVEIGFFDRGPINGDQLITGGFWSTYYYDGLIYGTEIVRGLDVLELRPSDYLTDNEIAAAALADMGGLFNPQQQFPVSWPAAPAVAMAYVDQLERSETIERGLANDFARALRRADSRLEDGRSDAELVERLESLAANLTTDSVDARTRERIAALRETIDSVGARLR
jgi:uncharacterized protein (DUF305 family)